MILFPTTFQKSLLYGCLLGDAYLYDKKGIIQIEQSVNHKDYLFWLFTQLQSLTTGKLPSKVTRFDKRTQKQTFSYRFYTRALFHEWRPLFYRETRVKKLPENFHESFDSTALAVWFLDDGGKCSGVKKGVFLTLDNYTLNEIGIIQQTFSTKFGIHAQLSFSGKTKKGLHQKRLTITRESYDKFYEIVYPIFSQIPEMERQKLTKV